MYNIHMLLGATSLVIPETLYRNIVSVQNLSATENAPYYRKRGFGKGRSPAEQYIQQKIMQNTLRVPSSIYTMNVGSLASFEDATTPERVCWNQMSDRKQPHIQRATVPSGGQYTTSSTRSSITRLRPGAMSPGGSGVDIKHNSYERHLNRLKGRSVLKGGVIPPNYGKAIKFDPAFPVYGGKTIKTGIINDCNCLHSTSPKPSLFPNNIYNVTYSYSVGQNVFAKKSGLEPYFAAKITSINNDGTYSVNYTKDNTTGVVYSSDMVPYYPCLDVPEDNPDYFLPSQEDMLSTVCNKNGLAMLGIQLAIDKYFNVSYSV